MRHAFLVLLLIAACAPRQAVAPESPDSAFAIGGFPLVHLEDPDGDGIPDIEIPTNLRAP